MITVELVAERIREALRGEGHDELMIDASTTLEDVGLSSLELTDIVFGIEEEFGFEFDEERAADATTLGELVDLANEAIAEQKAGMAS